MSFVLAQPVQFQQHIKKSRFHAFAWPIQHEQDIAHYLKQSYDSSANHQCWAWKLGQTSRYSDDGEPSGTAGRPILAVLEGQDWCNSLVVVNRWFGGVKLGTGGLVRAYSSSASQCLALAEKIERKMTSAISFDCTFAEWSIIEYQLQIQQIQLMTSFHEHGLNVSAQVNAVQLNWLNHFLQQLSRGRIQLQQDQSHDIA